MANADFIVMQCEVKVTFQINSVVLSCFTAISTQPYSQIVKMYKRQKTNEEVVRLLTYAAKRSQRVEGGGVLNISKNLVFLAKSDEFRIAVCRHNFMNVISEPRICWQKLPKKSGHHYSSISNVVPHKLESC